MDIIIELLQLIIELIKNILGLIPSGVLEAIGTIAVIYFVIKFVTKLIARLIIIFGIILFFYLLQSGFFDNIINITSSV